MRTIGLSKYIKVAAVVLFFGTGLRAVQAADVSRKEGQPQAAEYKLSDFVRKTPDKTVRSWRELKFGTVDSEAGGCTMRQVLADFGVASAKIGEADPSKPLAGFDVLVLAGGVVDRNGDVVRGAGKIQEFVNGGGICWILSQDHETWTCQWLPERLRRAKLTHQYGLRCVGNKAPHYLCPWLVERHHAVFNHPNHLDESDFSFWALTVDNVPCFTTAFSALTQAPGWDVLGRYADPSCADGAIILQAPDGEGLYFWTQIFSPQIVWNQPNKRPRQTWEKFLENVLTYFVSLRRGELWRIESQPRPWSVLAGESLAIESTVESPLAVEQASAEVRAPDGKLTEVTLSAVRDGLLSGQFTPQQGGEHFVRITVSFRGGAVAHDHFALKVTKGWTAYRSIAHIHMRDCNGYGTQCAGTLFGAARYLGYDVIQLAAIVDDGRWDEMRMADNPACRFVPGCELHYRIYKRSGERSEWFCEDIRAIGIPEFIPYPHRIYEDEAQQVVAKLVEKIHAQGGLVCDEMSFWARRGLPIDMTEPKIKNGIEQGFSVLSPLWEKQRRIWGMGAVDCHGIITLLTRRNWNVVWLDKPLTIPNFLAAIKAGRSAVVRKIDLVWLDVAGQPMGGVVYAVDEVPIHFRIDAGEPPKDIGTVRWPAKPKGGTVWIEDMHYYKPDEQAYVVPPEPARTIRRVEVIKNTKVVKAFAPNTRELEETVSDRIDSDAWYFLRADSSDGHAYTNPVFVKRIDGPPGAWLWTRGEIARITCDRKEKRWRIELSTAGDLRFRIPGRTVSCTIDGEPSTCRLDPHTGIGQMKLPTDVKGIDISWRSK